MHVLCPFLFELLKVYMELFFIFANVHLFSVLFMNVYCLLSVKTNEIHVW